MKETSPLSSNATLLQVGQISSGANTLTYRSRQQDSDSASTFSGDAILTNCCDGQNVFGQAGIKQPKRYQCQVRPHLTLARASLQA